MNLDRRTAVAALAAAGLLWGTTVPLTKLALEWLPPGWLTVARFGLAAAVLLVAVRFRVGAVCHPAVLAWGAVGYGGSILVQNAGITRTSVSHAALLVGATPVLVAVIAAVAHHSVARPVAWTGFAVSLAGVGLVAAGGGGGATLAGDGLVLASLGFSASFTVAQARLLPGRDPVAVTAVQFLAAALATLPVAAVTEGAPPAAGGAGAWLATAGLVLLGTLAPATLFAFGQARVSAEIAGSFVNLEPLVGAAAGAAVFGDPVGLAQAAGAAAIVTGIALSSLPLLRPGAAAPGQPSMPSRAAALAASALVWTPSLARMAETWWSTVLGETNRRRAMSALRSPSLTSASTSVSLAVRLAGLALVEGRGPRARPRAPSSRSLRATAAARGRAPSRWSSASAVRSWGSWPLSARAPAASYGQPRARQRSAAASQRPATCRANGSAAPSGSRPGRSRPGPPRRHRQKASSPASQAWPSVRSASSSASSTIARAAAGSSPSQAASARAMATGPRRCSSPVPVPVSSASASSSGGHTPGSPRRARTRPRTTRASIRLGGEVRGSRSTTSRLRVASVQRPCSKSAWAWSASMASPQVSRSRSLQ